MTPNDADFLIAVAQALSGTSNPQEIARRAAREVTRLLGADTSVYFLIDEKYEYAVAFAGYHVPETLLRPELARIRIGDLPVLIGDAIGRLEPAATVDQPGHPLFEHAFIRSLPMRPQALLYAPVLENARLKGALVTYWWNDPHAVTEREIRLAMTVARQVALALSAAQALSESEVRRQQAEAAEARYRALFERSLAGLFRTRRDGTITDCNQTFVDILGYKSPDEAIGRHASEFYIEPEERTRLLAAIEGRAGAVTNLEMTLKRKDGRPVAVLMNVATPVVDGELTFEGQILDITDRMRAEVARREAAALRSVASLANGAAHSINNPLTVIRGTLELLLQRQEKPTAQRIAPAIRAIDEIADVIRRMSRITRLELMSDAPGEMRMLDIRESAPEAPPE